MGMHILVWATGIEPAVANLHRHAASVASYGFSRTKYNASKFRSPCEVLKDVSRLRANPPRPYHIAFRPLLLHIGLLMPWPLAIIPKTFACLVGMASLYLPTVGRETLTSDRPLDLSPHFQSEELPC
jgi:hypothetical protein